MEGATFAWPTTGIVFPIHDIVPQVTFAQFQDIDLEIREEQLCEREKGDDVMLTSSVSRECP